MKHAIMTAVMALTAMAAPGSNPENTVTVCLDGHPGFILTAASAIASTMFAAIDVNVVWRRVLTGCPADAILVSFKDQTPTEFLPGALAYALPYEGTHICLLYDRVVQARETRQAANIMAHVLVHEITHILQGVCHHSASGIMKARWDGADFSQMAWEPLKFTAQDIQMIRQGLEARHNRFLLAAQIPPDVAAR